MALMTSVLSEYASFPVLIGKDSTIRWAHFKIKRYNKPSEIVLHYTTGNIFENDVWYISKENERRISVHFVIAQDGRYVLICPLDYAAWHAGNWNHNVASIGIELTHPNDDSAYPEPQLAATVELCWILCQLFDISVEKIIGHCDIVKTICPRGLDVQRIRDRVLAMEDAT